MNMKIATILIVTLFVAITLADPIQQTCHDNEEWKECGTKCPDTCLNRDIKNRACIKMCVTGCFCRDGFIRLGYDMTGGIGHCVPVDYCDLIPRN
ncbi:hypothetical protein DERF_006355 [Dermatophagoides farinae]|uniref:Cysteine rich trypsin inhibitor-like protein n=1 Tax=Dermatophagoides farinae TaxID=6954 RepID=A0A922IA69_DERFA|nr:cysteine-rich venom protein 6-like [Dermatophagoides farinae]KAH7638889.1 cysteine rich trypsin inhibitor-like protein [Dermatophagoides farinae]KAH9522794.1 hypothetical protein DERF_006355 [Dermatophagoides farinae]